MSTKLKKAIERMKMLPPDKQEQLANLILDEIEWDMRFEQTPEGLARLAKEAQAEDDAGNTKDWDL